jgi:hypothetical protein
VPKGSGEKSKIDRNEPTRRRGTVGRPRVLDAEMRGTVKLLLGIGCSLKMAARVAGCAPCTVRREMLRDPAFGDELREARHGARAGFVLNLINAAQTSESAADCLRRRILEAVDGAPPPRAKIRPRPYPHDGSAGAQNWLQFCALHAMRSLENSRSAVPQKRAKSTSISGKSFRPKRAKLKPRAPADFMSPREFVAQQRARKELARMSRSSVRGRKT